MDVEFASQATGSNQMGLAAYVKNTETNETEVIPIAGSSELKDLWKPIIEQNQLKYLDYIMTAGLDLDGQNHLPIETELRTLLRTIEALVSDDDEGSSIARCRRLLKLVSAFDPNGTMSLYVG